MELEFWRWNIFKDKEPSTYIFKSQGTIHVALSVSNSADNNKTTKSNYIKVTVTATTNATNRL